MAVIHHTAKLVINNSEADTCVCWLQGTLDCILCRDTGLEDVVKALQVIWNNLKSSAVFVMVSHGTPEMRLPLLQQSAWETIQVTEHIPCVIANRCIASCRIIRPYGGHDSWLLMYHTVQTAAIRGCTVLCIMMVIIC